LIQDEAAVSVLSTG